MNAYNGDLFLLKIKAKDGQFKTIGGLRATKFLLNNKLIDCTNKLSGGWREILPQAGISHVSVTGSGLFTNSETEKEVKNLAFNNKIQEYQINFASGDVLLGKFQITSYERMGNYNEEEIYNVTLESSGKVTYY